jgi:hypothetical protein
MLKLILHHTYKLDGEAIDLSHHHNHGYRNAVSFQPDGRSPGSGTLEFANDESRIHVPYKPVWNQPLALRIEAWVRLAELGRQHTIVVGQNSFSLTVRPDGVLEGTFLLPGTPGGPPPPSLRVNSDGGSPDGVRRTVPVDTWTRLTYFHDGLATLRLYIDETLAASAYDVRFPVRSVGPGGVIIGHGLAGHDRTLRGEIDEIQIWKYDRQSPSRQFNDRPMDEAQRECWRDFQAHLREVLEDSAKRQLFNGLMLCIMTVMRDLIREVRSRGEAAIQRQEVLLGRYMELWSRGELTGDGMRAFMRDWIVSLQETLGPPAFEGFMNRFQGCREQFQDLDLAELGGGLADCDPDFAVYVYLMGDVLSEIRPDLGWPAEEPPEPETPGEGLPDQESPGQESPDQETPDQGSPDQDTPDQETPDQKPPDPGTPRQDTPDQETPDQGPGQQQS